MFQICYRQCYKDEGSNKENLTIWTSDVLPTNITRNQDPQQIKTWECKLIWFIDYDFFKCLHCHLDATWTKVPNLFVKYMMCAFLTANNFLLLQLFYLVQLTFRVFLPTALDLNKTEFRQYILLWLNLQFEADILLLAPTLSSLLFSWHNT